MRFSPIAITAIVLGGLLSACATGPPQTHPHLMVDPEGYALADDGGQMRPADYDARIDAILAGVRGHVQNMAAQNKTARILVYVHGGLISQADSLRYIESMVGDDGRLKGTDYYPVFINWDASLGSALYDDLFEVRRGTRDPLIGYPTAPFVALSRLLSGVAELPVKLVYQYDTEKMQFESWEGEERSGGELIGNGIITIASLPITVATLPVIAGFGEGAWKMLRRRTEQMFAYQIRPEKHIFFDQVRQPGALRQFFEKIYTVAEGDHAGVELTLVGHSMGAIVVNKILRAFPRIKFDRVIYMAAAASIEDFMNTVPPYLELHPGTHFYSFSLSNRDEGGEFNWFLPRGSLLVWIDNMYEPGISPTGKRVGFFRNEDIIRIRPMAGVCCRQMTFIKFTGLAGQPRKHGQFNDDGVFQRILEWAHPEAVARLQGAEGFVFHYPCE